MAKFDFVYRDPTNPDHSFYLPTMVKVPKFGNGRVARKPKRNKDRSFIKQSAK